MTREEAKLMALSRDCKCVAGIERDSNYFECVDEIFDWFEATLQSEPGEGFNPIREHIHIPIAGGKGHVTWHGEEPPSEKMMEAFEELAEVVYNEPEYGKRMFVEAKGKEATHVAHEYGTNKTLGIKELPTPPPPTVTKEKEHKCYNCGSNKKRISTGDMCPDCAC